MQPPAVGINSLS